MQSDNPLLPLACSISGCCYPFRVFVHVYFLFTVIAVIFIHWCFNVEWVGPVLWKEPNTIHWSGVRAVNIVFIQDGTLRNFVKSYYPSPTFTFWTILSLWYIFSCKIKKKKKMVIWYCFTLCSCGLQVSVGWRPPLDSAYVWTRGGWSDLKIIQWLFGI